MLRHADPFSPKNIEEWVPISTENFIHLHLVALHYSPTLVITHNNLSELNIPD